MERLHALVDDYLRVIVRTRPWTRRAEEEMLTSFAGWVSEDARRLDVEAPGCWDAVAARYAVERGPGPDREVEMAVRSFCAWAEAEVGREGVRGPGGLDGTTEAEGRT